MNCESCKDDGFIWRQIAENGTTYDVCKPCPACAKGQAQLNALRGITPPRKEWAVTLKKYAHQQEAIRVCKRALAGYTKGILLWSPDTGTGKTAIMRNVYRALIEKGVRPAWLNWSDAVETSAKSYSNDREEKLEATLIRDTIAHSPVLFLDDVGAGGSTNLVFLERVWAQALSDRIDYSLQTFATSNFSIMELGPIIGERIQSRLRGLLTPHQLDGPDLREKNQNG